MKIYNVFHAYDADGEFGDACPVECLVATFASETDAKTFVEKYSHPYVYAKPYNELYCNEYFIREIEVVSHEEFNINKTPKDYGIWVPERKCNTNENYDLKL